MNRWTRLFCDFGQPLLRFFLLVRVSLASYLPARFENKGGDAMRCNEIQSTAFLHARQSLGASGAIFGLAGAGTVRHLMGSFPSVELFIASLAQTALFAFVVAMVVPNIDNMGHLGVSKREDTHGMTSDCASSVSCPPHHA